MPLLLGFRTLENLGEPGRYGNQAFKREAELVLAGAPGNRADAHFKTLDKDSDGKVTGAEREFETEELFAGRDVNKDDKLTPKEMGLLQRLIGLLQVPAFRLIERRWAQRPSGTLHLQ